MVHIILRLILTIPALIADLIYTAVNVLLLIILFQHRVDGTDLPTLKSLWRRPWFKNE